MPDSRRFAALIALAILACSACSDSEPKISVSIAGQFRRSAGAVVDLAEANPSGWDRVCVLAPYSTNAFAKHTLGFDWDAEGKSVIHRNDGINLLVFVTGNHVSDFVEHPRNLGDFASLSGKCFPRASAKFEQKPESKAGPAGLYPKSS